MMRRPLEKLDECCKAWAVRVVVDKCGIMHMRKKDLNGSQQKFVVNGRLFGMW